MSQFEPGSEPHYDVLIVGGGLVGASLACALTQACVRVALLEAKILTGEQPPSYDDRAIALSHGSLRILDGVGIWPLLRDQSTPIRQIHVSDRGHFGFVRMNAADHEVDAFGAVTDARSLGTGIQTCLSRFKDTAVFGSSRLQSVRVDNDAVRAVIRDHSEETQIVARLLVAADGGNSLVRRLLGIGAERRDYPQRAITSNVTPSRAHDSIAYERFTASGPLAFLPMRLGRCGLIWSASKEQAEVLMSANDRDFLSLVQDAFGWRLGKLEKCGRRTEFPLALIKTNEQIRPRLAVVGNAANTLHPIAGQGLNLGLRDVSALAQTVVDALRQGEDPGNETVLEGYARWRRRDHRAVTRFTDSVVRVFANPLTPVILGRNLGLVAVDLVPGLKNALVERAMGLSGRQTRLARGLTL